MGTPTAWTSASRRPRGTYGPSPRSRRTDLKKIATEIICDRFDHAFVYNTASEGEREIAAVVERYGMRTVALAFRSTAENLAKMFYEELRARVPGVSSVKVWETADSCAEYRA